MKTVNVKQNKFKIILFGVAALAILILGSIIVLFNSKKLSETYDPELARAMTYPEFTAADKKTKVIMSSSKHFSQEILMGMEKLKDYQEHVKV